MKTDLVDCDVNDKESLALFRHHMFSNKTLLIGQDRHSLQNQISELFVNYTMYKCFSKALTENYPSRIYPNGFVHPMLSIFISSFYESHFMAIRRIVDINEYNPNRKVICLERFIDSVIENHKLYTRENYVCYDGVKYGDTPNENWQNENLRDYRHAVFDELSDRKIRNRNDIVSLKKIKDIKKRLVKFEKLKYITNKYYAHSSDVINRKNIPDEAYMKIDDLEILHKELEIIIHEIVKYYDELVITYLPTMTFDQFKNWDKPIANKVIIDGLRIYWREKSIESSERSRKLSDINREDSDI